MVEHRNFPAPPVSATPGTGANEMGPGANAPTVSHITRGWLGLAFRIRQRRTNKRINETKDNFIRA